MNAYMAKGLTLQREQDKFDSDMNTVMKLIDEAIIKEKTYCNFSSSWYDFRYDYVLDRLEKLGYIVTKDDSFIEVSWNI